MSFVPIPMYIHQIMNRCMFITDIFLYSSPSPFPLSLFWSSLSLSVALSIHLFIFTFFHSSIHLLIHYFVCSSVHWSPSIHPSIFSRLFSLLDIDECAAVNNCDINSECENTMGSYNCTCHPGYSGTGTSCCKLLIFMLWETLARTDFYTVHVKDFYMH